jgi:hypothetical protein
VSASSVGSSAAREGERRVPASPVGVSGAFPRVPAAPNPQNGAEGREGSASATPTPPPSGERESAPHCETCQCGRWAPVQSRSGSFVVSWPEHLKAWEGYAAEGHGGQDAETIARRAGFSVGELRHYLGHEPTTLRPRQASR